MPYYGTYDPSPRLTWSGKGGVLLALLVLLIPALLPGTSAVPGDIVGSGYGVCLPSVASWHLDPTLSLWLNMSMIALAAGYSILLTKHFNFVPPDNLIYATSLLLMCGVTPWVSERLNSGVLMLLVVLVCLHILFALYGRRNSSEGIFLVFGFLSWGSMVQYGFLLMMPVFLLGAVFLRNMKGREVVAMLLGIAAPYWILTATGVVELSDYHMPALTNLFDGAESPVELLRLMLTVGVTAILFLLMLLLNSMRRTPAGVLMRARWDFLQLLGFSSLWFMVFDFTNMIAYIPTFFLCTGYECAQWGIRMKPQKRFLLILGMFVVYVAIAVVFGLLPS